MVQNILIGLKAYTNSLSLISKLKLWKYFAIPILISVLTATAIGFLAYLLSDNIGGFISKIWIWEWGKETFTTFSSVLGGLIIIVIGLIVYRHIVMALSTPFMSPVSEQIEKHLIKDDKHEFRITSFSQQLWRGVRINIRNLAKEMLITIPVLLLGFIPLVGIFSTAILFLIQAYYAGFGNMDYTLERHFDYRRSIDFVKNRKGLAIGNGIVFMLLLVIPVIGVIIVLPLSVVAATKITVNELHK